MSYSAFNGIEYLKDGKWVCLKDRIPEELRKLHYGFGARNCGMPFVEVDDFDNGNRDFSPEINKLINGPFTEVTHYNRKPDTEEDRKTYFSIMGKDATEESWQESLKAYVPNPNGGFDVTKVDTDFKYPVLGVVSFDKLIDIRDRIFTEIKNKTHLYYTPKEALELMLQNCDGLNKKTINVEEIKDSIKYIFSHSESELRDKGFLTNDYAVEDYNDLEYYFYAVQFALNIMEHYVEEYNDAHDFKDYISEVNCRFVMWGC